MLRRTSRIQQPRAQRRRRSLGARIVLLLMLGFLITPLYRLQVEATERYTDQARQNRMRAVVVRAPRGTVYDRHGRVVAENIVGYQVLLMPASEDSLRSLIQGLAPITELDSADVRLAFRRYRTAKHLPMELIRDASPDVAARLYERMPEFPGVLVQPYAKRHYPAGAAIAHFIGYISEISQKDLATDRFKGYEQGRWIGKAGLELQYEEHVGGTPGVRYIEVDARGRIRRFVPEEDLGVPPVPGKDLHLYLDLDLQEYIAKIFPKQYTGAIVALDPKTGGVLAYYSHPTYDPNEFIGGVSVATYQELMNDEAKPMLDRVVGSGQPAASTWKLAVAGMALDQGVIEPDEYMPIPCTGGLFYGRWARCWNSGGHGRQDLINGIKNSCNVYFYQLGIRLGLKRFLETGTRLGFPEKTGIDVPHEIKPNFPTGLEYWERHFGYRPNDNEVLSLAIGQGPLTMTLIKLTHIYAALGAPDGTVPAPRLAMEAAESGAPRDTFTFDLDANDRWHLAAGMRRVVAPGGTAAASQLAAWDFFGKTGTAQNPHGPAHAWFVGMGAKEVGADPEIAVTMFLEHAEKSSIPAGYVAEAVNFYLSRKYGRPFQLYATPRLRGENGLPANNDGSASVEDPPMPGEQNQDATTGTAPTTGTGGNGN